MQESQRLPNFLIVGAAKAATTSIHDYLNQHPDIYMSQVKEPCFFTFKDQTKIEYSTGGKVGFITDINEYQLLFKDSEDKKIRGESSTPYLYFHKKTIKNIKETLPNPLDVKILIILRNPIERAYSQYMMMKVWDFGEHESFYNALQVEKKRIAENAHFDFFYADRGLYYQQVNSYLNNFKNVKILLYEDFNRNWLNSLHEIIEFLELPKYEFKEITKRNISGDSRFPFVTKILTKKFLGKRLLGKMMGNNFKKIIFNYIMFKNLKKSNPMDKKSRRYLNDFYREDIKNLEQILKKDLNHW